MHHTGQPFSIRIALRALFSETVHSSHHRNQHFLSARRAFHDYFVTHLPSSSLSPDRGGGPSHKLPRNASSPHSGPTSRSATQISPNSGNSSIPNATKLEAPSRDTTIVRIPLRSAKHHFGAGVSRGSRPYNEDTYQAGTIEIPAFAKKAPISLNRKLRGEAAEIEAARGESGDPQVFYFGVFDGHGGSECSEFLRERLHAYIEESALLFGLQSSLQKDAGSESSGMVDSEGGIMGEQDAEDLQKSLVSDWRETVGGYFRRFKPEYFPAIAGSKPSSETPATVNNSSIETVLSYAFLKADLDFTSAQAAKHTTSQQQTSPSTQTFDDSVLADRPLNDNDLLFHPDRPASQNLLHKNPSRPGARGSSPNLSSPIGGDKRFKGGSTCSVAMISTPTPAPFWHPGSPSTLIVAHVGDTRILLCRTSDGKSVPLTLNHHPSTPHEAARLRRYASMFITDSFGEERVLGLANTRAFGDISSKRIGVSAEPQITTTHISPAEYSFMVLISDGVCGHLSDQEIVDVVKEARTPAQASLDLVGFAVETGGEDADNATALVVRLGGWERRSEGGVGSMGTREQRDWRREEAMDPRRRGGR